MSAPASTRQEFAMAQPDDGRPAEPVPSAEHQRRLFASRADVTRFLLALARRFLSDLCLERAAALSYTAVVSLVPAAAVSLAFLSALPESDMLRADVEDFLTRYLLPNAGETALEAFRAFIAKAAGLSALGFLGLAVTAIMLLITVNTAFDTIWRVTRPRPLLIRLLAYGAILTVGPLLIGLALSISGLLLATGEHYAGAAFAWSIG
jgi:membrane protein